MQDRHCRPVYLPTSVRVQRARRIALTHAGSARKEGANFRVTARVGREDRARSRLGKLEVSPATRQGQRPGGNYPGNQA